MNTLDTLDTETIEQIKNIVSDAANAKVPLQKEKKARKPKQKQDVKPVEPKLLPGPDPSSESPEPQPVEVNPEPSAEPQPVVEPVKKKRVQTEKQKAAFALLQEKRKEQVEKLKLVKKIEASKLLLENDVKLKAQKPKSTTVKFNDFSNYESDDSYYDSEPEPQAVTKPVAKLVKQWGMSTRNKKSVKNVTQPIKEKEKAVESNYQEPVYF